MTAKGTVYPEDCPICGAPIPRRPSGKTQRLTCSPACAAQAKGAARRRRAQRDREEGRRMGARRQASGARTLAREVAADARPPGIAWEALLGHDWSAGDCPRRRGDDGPCVHVGCRYHACSDITETGGLWVDARFVDDPYSVPWTCTLDIPAGDLTLEDVGALLGVTRERIRQIGVSALACYRRRMAARGWSRADLARGHATALADLQGARDACHGSHERIGLRHVEIVALATGECRHPGEPHVEQPLPARAYPLPPSLEAHRDELGGPLRVDCLPAPWELRVWRNGRRAA